MDREDGVLAVIGKRVYRTVAEKEKESYRFGCPHLPRGLESCQSRDEQRIPGEHPDKVGDRLCTANLLIV